MKGMDLLCASQASTAICMSMDERSTVRSHSSSSSRGIDRHNPHLRDGTRRRSRASGLTPSYSQSSSTKSKAYTNNHEKRRHSSAHPADLLTPTSSSRYLLSQTSFFDDHYFNKTTTTTTAAAAAAALVPLEPTTTKPRLPSRSLNSTQSPPVPVLFKPTSPTRPRDQQQAVVLKVSLHCKGCEGKVRKHISKMEGVTSFSIDFATKKVTVVGDVTPVSVLASVSRVKNAQFWPLSSSSASLSAEAAAAAVALVQVGSA